MDHGGEAARQMTAGSTELGTADAVQGSEGNSITSGTFDGQLGAVAAPPGNFRDFDVHHEPGPGVAYPNNGASWRQLSPIGVVLVVVGPQLPDGVARVHDNDGYYSVLQPRPGPGARRGVMLVNLLHGGGTVAVLVHNGDYTLQAPPGAQRGEVLVDLLPYGAGHGAAFVGLLPRDGVAAFDDYVSYSLLLRPGAGHGQVLTSLLPNGAGHGEVFPSGGVAVNDDYGYYVWQPRLDAGRGEVLPDGVGVVFDGSGNFAWQTLPDPGTRGADGIAGALRGPNLGEGYDNRGVVAQHLRRLLPLAGIAASSVAFNGLAAGPGSPAVAFHLFVLLLGGLFLVMLHVLRV